MKIFSLSILIIICQLSPAQNIGIGTTTPQAKLDIVNSFRVGGPLKFMKYDSLSGTLMLNNSLLVGANVANDASNATLDVRRGTSPNGTAYFWGTNYHSHFNFQASENTYIRGGKAGSNVIINDLTGGNVGIGTSTPQARLDIAGTIKISGGLPGTGKILISDAVGNASWGENIKTYSLNTFTSYSNVITNDEYELPNSTLTIPVTVPSRLIISAGYLMENSCPIIGSCDGRAIFFIRINGFPIVGLLAAIYLKSTGEGYVNGTLPNTFYDVGPGMHELKFFTKKDAQFGSVNYEARPSSVTVVVLPL